MVFCDGVVVQCFLGGGGVVSSGLSSNDSSAHCGMVVMPRWL